MTFWQIVLLGGWVAFSPVIGISIGQIIRWCQS